MSDCLGAITPNVLISLANSGADPTRYLKQMFILYEKLLYFPQSGDSEGALWMILGGFSGKNRAERDELRANHAFGEAIVESRDIWTQDEHWKVLMSTMLFEVDAPGAVKENLDNQLRQLVFGKGRRRQSQIAHFKNW